MRRGTGNRPIILISTLILIAFRSITIAIPVVGHGTVSIPTTQTPNLGISTVEITPGEEDHANVRSGPGTDFDIIGSLLAGQKVPGLGRSAGGDWVEVAYPQGPGGVGWIYAYLVSVKGMLPVAELPPTPTPLVTPTIDATLASQFIIEIPPTRLPTFTPPPPLALPTFPTDNPIQAPGTSPWMVYLMIGLGIVGALGILVSFIRVR